jgi:all-trans-retinol 13,14-reductase
MSNEWDTIIIGAGVGGLTAASKLVRAGLRVLMLERNPHPGGTAYVYHRKGFTFPMGPLGFTQPGLIRGTLKDLGEWDDLKFHRVHYRVNAFNLEIPLSLPLWDVKKKLTDLFPLEAHGVGRFFHRVEAIGSSAPSPNPHIDASITKRAGETSAAEYVKGLVNDFRLRRILGSLGTREPYSSLTFLAAMWNVMSKEGIWYPEGGMRSLCERLARAVDGQHKGKELPNIRGGEGGRGGGIGMIRLGAEVRRIRVKKGKILGVTLDDGTQIDADSIISNADYKTTFLKLVDPRMIPTEWCRAVLNAKQSGSVLQVCLGVNSIKADLSSFDEASRLIYRRSLGNFGEEEIPEWDATEVEPETLASQEMEVSLWSRDDSTLAPNGAAVIVIRTEAPYSHFIRYRSISGERLPAYNEYKAKLSRALIRGAENLIPGLEAATMVSDVATPLTFEERGGRSEGAVAGWSWDYEDFHNDRPRELVRTPIERLYMAGYEAFSALFMGGVPTAIESGKRAAEAVLRGIGPIEEMILPGSGGASRISGTSIISHQV